MFRFNPVQTRPALTNVILTHIVVFEVVTAVKYAPSVSSGPRKFYGSSSFCGSEDSKCQAGEMDSLFNWKFSSEFMWFMWALSAVQGLRRGQAGAVRGGSGWGLGEGAETWGVRHNFISCNICLHLFIQPIILDSLWCTRHCTGPWGCHHFEQFSFQDPQHALDFPLKAIVCEHSVHQCCS